MTQLPTPYGLPTAGSGDDGARLLAVSVLVLGAIFTASSIMVEVPATILALDHADSQDPSTLTLLALGVLGIGSVVLLLPLWIVTCLWIRAERLRLTHSQGRHFKHGTAGTFFSWIVPFANLVWPYRIVGELHDAAVESSRRVGLGPWWAAWLVWFISGRVSSRLFDSQGLGDPAGAILALSAVSATALVVAFYFWFRIVQTTSRGAGG